MRNRVRDSGTECAFGSVRQRARMRDRARLSASPNAQTGSPGAAGRRGGAALTRLGSLCSLGAVRRLTRSACSGRSGRRCGSLGSLCSFGAVRRLTRSARSARSAGSTGAVARFAGPAARLAQPVRPAGSLRSPRRFPRSGPPVRSAGLGGFGPACEFSPNSVLTAGGRAVTAAKVVRTKVSRQKGHPDGWRH
jgi:hypothetical protein